MTEKEILKKAIETAIKNGFIQKYPIETWRNGWLRPTYKVIIFDHSFAKAFWKDNKLGFKSWQAQLQRMVLEPNPIQYLAKFLDKENK